MSPAKSKGIHQKSDPQFTLTVTSVTKGNPDVSGAQRVASTVFIATNSIYCSEIRQAKQLLKHRRNGGHEQRKCRRCLRPLPAHLRPHHQVAVGQTRRDQDRYSLCQIFLLRSMLRSQFALSPRSASSSTSWWRKHRKLHDKAMLRLSQTSSRT